MSLEKFDQIISEYENKTRRMLEGLAQPRCSITRRALTSDRPRYLFADTVFKEVYRPTLREMNELREEFMKCYYSPEPGSGYLDAKDSFERLNLENTPSLEKFDQIISDYKNKTRRFFGMVEHWDSPRTLFFDNVFNGVYRFALRNMNMLRQEFMKCHYSPNPGQGYLEAKDSFESRLTFEGQSGGKRRLKYHYNGGSPENDLFKVIRYIHEEKSFRPEQVNWKLLVALLSPALNIETRNKDGYTPLSLAVRELDVNMVKMLLRLGANPNSTYRGGSRYLVHYLANDDRGLENDNLEDSSDDEYVRLSLSKQLEIMKLLLVNGANVNEIQTPGGYTPLHYAVERNNSDLVELLLKHGANTEIKAEMAFSDAVHQTLRLERGVYINMPHVTPIEYLEREKQFWDENFSNAASKTLKILEKHEAKRETKKLLTDQLGRTLLLDKDDPNNNRDPDDTRPHLSGHKNKVINTIKSYYGGKGKKKTRKLVRQKKTKSKKLKSKKLKSKKRLIVSPVKKELPIHCIGYTKNKECIPTGLVLPFF